MAIALVVDDSPVDRHRVGGLLQKKPGWDVIYAANGAEALATLDQQRPDLVITDLRMPNLNGLELVEAIRKKTPSVPVILITAFGNEDLAIMALERGAASYVPKRNLSRRLHETVEQVLDVARARGGHQRVLELLARSEVHYVLENDRSLIPDLVGHLRINLVGLGLCDQHEAIRVGVALTEALNNAIHHGNLEVSSELLEQNEQAYEKLVTERRRQPPYKDRRVHLVVKESREEIVYLVRDEGPGFDPKKKIDDPTTAQNLERPRGRGLLLIRTFMDAVSYNDRGNEITLVKRRRG
jgi:DNA-binding NarL/FixJ family response regulator/anti-sigma regulatory factor (Ser/Thr protein kinase)